ncbi:MAG: hypothetical protein KO202_05825 [Methanobacteriaceae archaeon]|jgi:transposase-like protein|nr:hypothetical protein [Methanobacteriaceae archaeon]
MIGEDLKNCPRCKHGLLRITSSRSENLEGIVLKFKCNNCDTVMFEEIAIQ